MQLPVCKQTCMAVTIAYDPSNWFITVTMQTMFSAVYKLLCFLTPLVNVRCNISSGMNMQS